MDRASQDRGKYSRFPCKLCSIGMVIWWNLLNSLASRVSMKMGLWNLCLSSFRWALTYGLRTKNVEDIMLVVWEVSSNIKHFQTWSEIQRVFISTVLEKEIGALPSVRLVSPLWLGRPPRGSLSGPQRSMQMPSLGSWTVAFSGPRTCLCG